MLKLVRIEVFFASSSYKRTFLNWLLLVFKILGQAQLSDDSRLRWDLHHVLLRLVVPSGFSRWTKTYHALRTRTRTHTRTDGRRLTESQGHAQPSALPALPGQRWSRLLLLWDVEPGTACPLSPELPAGFQNPDFRTQALVLRAPVGIRSYN